MIDPAASWHWTPMPRLALFLPLLASALAVGCGDDLADGGGAAHPGVDAQVLQEPDVTIDDEFGTDVDVRVTLEHDGGPAAETFEVVSANLDLDLEHYADVELAIPQDHPAFDGLAEGQNVDIRLRGSIPDVHDDWNLCLDVAQFEDDQQRVTLDLVLRVTPGANDADDEFLLESLAVALHCSHTG